MPNPSKLSFRAKPSPSRKASHVPSVDEVRKTLHEAAFLGDRRKVKKMLLYGLNVDYPDEKGQTALYVACMESHEGLVELLLKHGANPNQRNLEGDTPVHAAANSGTARILKLLVDAGGDLRLHNRRGLTARDWAWKLADPKKRKNILDFIEKRRSTAITQSGIDLQNMSFQSQVGSKSLSALKRQRHKSLIGSTSVHSDGFGQICVEKGASVGAVATLPMIQEGSIRHDLYGYTYDNGPFMVMESMLWNKEPVTSKRLHKEPREGGHVDLLISELSYMSRLSHPSILLLMGTCRINNLEGLVLVYERVGLGSLFCCLYQKMETFSRVSFVTMLQQTANALLYLHRQNLLHCHVSSHSIQLVRPGFAKLSNFEYMMEGGSKAYVRVVENKYLNAAYNWLAPEVLAGQQPTEKSDLYGLCAVLWEFVNGQVPWHNVPADTIVLEMVERGHLLELGDHIEDPFNIMLQYGLSGLPDERRLSLEQMRDHLSEYIADCERLRKGDELHDTNASTSLILSERRDPRHAHFSPDVEIVSTSSGDVVSLSAEDIDGALENLSPLTSSRAQTLDYVANVQQPSTDKENKITLESQDLKDSAAEGSTEPPVDDRNRITDKEETVEKVAETKSQALPMPEHCNQQYGFLHQPLKQSTPLVQHSTNSKSVTCSESDTKPTVIGRDMGAEERVATQTKDCYPVESNASGAKESGSRVSFDFIQNPVKKAFFEGTTVSPYLQSVVSSSPRSGGSTFSPRSVPNHVNRSVINQHRPLKIPPDDAFALELQRETEEFIKSPTVKTQPTKTNFKQHSYGYYANNIYRSRGDYERHLVSKNGSASLDIRNPLWKKVTLSKGSNSPTFGVSLRELKAAVNQKIESTSGTKEEQMPKESESSSLSVGSVASQASEVSDSTLLANDCPEAILTPTNVKKFSSWKMAAEPSESKTLPVSMATTRQHLSFVASQKFLPKYSSGIMSSTMSPNYHSKADVAEDEVEKAMISSSFTSKSNSKDISKPCALKSQMFVSKEKPAIGGICDQSDLSLGPKAKICHAPMEISGNHLDSQERLITRSIKPASHHEPCLLKPSKIGVNSGILNSSAHGGGQLASDKDYLSTTLPSKPTPFKDKRLEMLKTEMDAMHRFKSDSVLQNKPEGAMQPRSSPQTPVPSGIGSRLPEPPQEVSIRDLISTYQTRVEEHKKKQSILTLKRNRVCGGDGLSVAYSANKNQWPNTLDNSTTPVSVQHCLTEGEPRLESKSLKSLSSTKAEEEPVANGTYGKTVCNSVSSSKGLGQLEKSMKDVCVSKLQLSLTSPAVAKIKFMSENDAALGVKEGIDKLDQVRGFLSGSSTRMSIQSGANEGSVSSASVTLLPRFQSIAVSTKSQNYQERATQKNQASPVESASSRISSADIKEFYYDDELNSPELAMEKHLRLQSTADFDSRENILANTPQRHPSFDYLPGTCDSSDDHGRDDLNRSKLENGGKKSAVTIFNQGNESNMKAGGLSMNGIESGADTDTDSTLSSMTEALCVTKRINTSHNDGYSSCVTVESHAKGYHTITCNKMDPLTGSKSTTYRAKVKAPRVITKFILDDADNGNQPFPV